MDVLEALSSRRSVKQFDSSHEMAEEDKKKLFEHAILSPTAFNIQHWRFVLVSDKSLREEIKKLSWNQAQVTDASLLIVLCADIKAWAKKPERYWSNSPQETKDFMVPAITNYYEGKEQTQRDEALRSCGIAAQSLMLAAKAIGYDSCPMDGFDFEEVGKLIKLPKDHLISMFITIGKAIAPAHERGGQLPLDEILIKNSFS